MIRTKKSKKQKRPIEQVPRFEIIKLQNLLHISIMVRVFMDCVRLERETHRIFPRSVHESARRGMGPEVHGQSDDRRYERHDWPRYKAASRRHDQVWEVADEVRTMWKANQRIRKILSSNRKQGSKSLYMVLQENTEKQRDFKGQRDD